MEIPVINVSEQPLATPNQPATQQQSKKKQRGRNAKAKSSQAFQRSSNEKTANAAREAAQKRLGVFNQDAAQLEASLQSMLISTQQRAIPLPIATRGAGFATVAEYSRLASAWNQEVIVSICTIHQYYRVTLFLIAYKVHLSRYSQHKEESFPLSSRFVISEEYRQVLQTINQVPISTYNILCTVGTIQGETAFSSYFPQDNELTRGEDVALYLNPFNIREAVVTLASEATEVEKRTAFYALNPIPGARWTVEEAAGPILQNSNAIWPEDYGVVQLLEDVHAYSNLLTRAGNRLPKSFLVNFEWNSHGSKQCATSFYALPSRLEASFTRIIVAPTRKKTRAIDGSQRDIEISTDQYRYNGDMFHGASSVVECWSHDGTATAMEMTTGVASFVGEVERIHTRLQVQGRVFAHISPGNVLYKMVDAPRS